MKNKSNPYSANKLRFHPEIINRLRTGANSTVIQVHLMPQNVCNHRCGFCSYRMPNNKNSETFDETQAIPIDKLETLVAEMQEIGVKAVEVTGGGEPLAHKHKYKMFELLINAGFDVALVTNGTLLDYKLAELLAPNLTWMRISIDAATSQSYSKVRNAPENHFNKALDAIKIIKKVGNHKPEFRFGVGYVMANGNELDVYDLCKIVKDLGVDNIRLSMTFSNKHLSYFIDEEKVKRGLQLADKAVEELADDSFQIFNLMPERYNNIVNHSNDYGYCYTKDVLCVIEGKGDVYTCCTFTGSNKGKIGNFIEHKEGFKGVWKDSEHFRKKLKPHTYCNVTCLYAKRNQDMIEIVKSNHKPTIDEKPLHVNFI